jgi:putative nucleotidyltransferase with HDIG domain
MKTDVVTFAQRATKLPSLPSVCTEVSNAIEQPDSSVDDIAAIIGRDPCLVARLLKLANSVFYGFSAQVGTIEQAVQLIGLNEIRDLVLASSVVDCFDQIPPDLLNVQAFWQHSVGCALICALLARERNEPEPERFFVGGLLHDVGRLVMCLEAPQESHTIRERTDKEGRLPCLVEAEVLGFDHAMLGAELASSWELPKSLVQMIRQHHCPGKPMNSLDTFLVQYADYITSSLGVGDSGERFISPLTVPPALKNCLLDDERLGNIIDELERQCEAIFPILTKRERSAFATSAA